jgi:hypothetical protein
MTPMVCTTAAQLHRAKGATFGWSRFKGQTWTIGLASAGLAALVEIARYRRISDKPGPGVAPPLRIELTMSCVPTPFDTESAATPLTPEDWVGMASHEVNELATLSDHLYVMMDLAGHEAELTEETFVRLDDLRWLLGNYVIKGGRVRRLIQLPDLLGSIESADQPGCMLPKPGIDTVRASATELLQRIKDTNTVTADWLMAHRVALPDPEYLDSNALLGRYRQLQIEPTSVSGDPLYLLTCHIHDILETVDNLGDLDHPLLDVLETQLVRILTAVDSEITTAQAFNTALISLVREVQSAEAA